jgi:TonB-dependent SusC/RagA subfamily outer membrane receptor
VDLIDYSNKQVHTEILRNKKGLAQGYLLFSDTLPEGNYQIRAYTNWMRNFDEEFFFSKTIEFKNPNYENVVTRTRIKSIKQFNRKLKNNMEKFVVNFFPEGGNMVAGLPVEVAFKAENMAGYSVNVSGKIIDQKGKEVADFKSVHEGMGSFTITPEADSKYYAMATFDDGKKEKYPLPAVLLQGTTIKVNSLEDNNIKLSIFSNKDVSNDEYANDFIIVGQSGGKAIYVSKVQWQGQPIHIDIPKKQFPAGIVQLTVFDGRSNPVCERLVFIDPVNTVKVISKIRQVGVAPSDSIEMDLVVVDKNGNPVNANLSLAVTEKANPNAYVTNIINSLYFSSDIKGRIINPGYYFDKSNPDVDKHLDLLLLTQGWRRFVWTDILANKLPMIKYQPSEGLSVGGTITRDFFGIPVRNSKVRMTVLSSYNDEFETVTDNYGRFNFPDLDYEDTMTVKIEAFKPTGGKGVLIILGDTAVPNVKTPTLAMFRNDVFKKSNIKTNVRKERLEFKKNYKGRPEPENQVPKIHNTPNDVIYVGQEASSYSDVYQYLQGKVPGVSVVGNKITIRGASSIYLSTDPLFLLDGVPIDGSGVGSINPLDLSVIEILKGPEAAIYGSRGANGVIAFYTKRGRFMKRGVIDFGMQGYQKHKEFYVAPYERFGYLTSEYNVPKTVYWKPTIVTNESGKATVKFKKNPKVDSHNFVIEGLTSEGDVVFYQQNQ